MKLYVVLGLVLMVAIVAHAAPQNTDGNKGGNGGSAGGNKADRKERADKMKEKKDKKKEKPAKNNNKGTDRSASANNEGKKKGPKKSSNQESGGCKGQTGSRKGARNFGCPKWECEGEGFRPKTVQLKCSDLPPGTTLESLKEKKDLKQRHCSAEGATTAEYSFCGTCINFKTKTIQDGTRIRQILTATCKNKRPKFDKCEVRPQML